MIVFELICAAQHRFEGWFASGGDFERQRLSGLLSCPICSTDQVTKLPTAKVGRSTDETNAGERPREPQQQPGPSAGAVAAYAAFVDHVLKNTENVGRAFPEEARKIHGGLAPRRGIRGTATREETVALLEEGIAVVSLPIPPPEEYH